jgi:hypothetical protein
MAESELTAVVDDSIWVLDRPVWFSGARLRARTTIVRLEDGGVLLHTPAPPTEGLARQPRSGVATRGCGGVSPVLAGL